MRNNLPFRKKVLSFFALICFSGLIFGQSTDLPIDNVIVGSVDNADDFSATVSLSWDGESIHMSFVVVDDSIVNAGTQYQVDNIEVYLDLDNSKNVHWPRNGGWMSDDPTFDDNDYQFRLVPDSAFSANNGFEGATQIYTRTDTGYNFELSIKWNDLMAGFSQVTTTLEQVSGTLIGFDALISDNDAEASDANRNQITFNSSTDKAFNDPSLWATLKAVVTDGAGAFEVIPDEDAPSVPGNVAAAVDESTITLSWDASTDESSAVLFYTVTLDGEEQDAIYAAEDGAVSIDFADMENGTYALAVMATDNNGNASDYSDAAEAIVDVSSIQEFRDIQINAYPNPTRNYLIIQQTNDVDNIQVISANGSVVLSKINNNSSEMSLDLSGLENGIYILKVNAGNEFKTARIIKE